MNAKDKGDKPAMAHEPVLTQLYAVPWAYRVAEACPEGQSRGSGGSRGGTLDYCRIAAAGVPVAWHTAKKRNKQLVQSR